MLFSVFSLAHPCPTLTPKACSMTVIGYTCDPAGEDGLSGRTDMFTMRLSIA